MMKRVLRRLFDTLQNRLLFTHMVVAVAVLGVAILLLLALQAPLRTESMLQRMAEWLLPTVTLARSNFASLAVATDPESARRFFDFLHSQASAQNVRILLVAQPDGRILFDSVEQAVGLRWEPVSRSPYERLPHRMRGGGRMGMMAEVVRGAALLEGQDWHYVSTLLLAANSRGIELVVLKMQPAVLQAMVESVLDLPGGLLASGLAALGLAVFLLSRWTAGAVTRSLNPLIAGTQALASGNLAYRVDTGQISLDELHVLATRFNQMADRVQQSQQAQRDFVANVSHDLKTPPTSIHGYSQALLDGTAESAEARQRAALVISQEAQRLTELVEELLDLARMENNGLQLQQVDLVQLGAEVLESFRPLFAAAQVELRWIPAADLPHIRGDAAKLRRVLTNLLDNALKHTPADGSVTLALQRLSAACQVEFTVVDSGEGISPQECERIWERFYRVDRARTRGRSGLGLAIVKEIVEAHGGAVGVDSHVGSGSTFWIRLPA